MRDGALVVVGGLAPFITIAKQLQLNNDWTFVHANCVHFSLILINNKNHFGNAKLYRPVGLIIIH